MCVQNRQLALEVIFLPIILRRVREWYRMKVTIFGRDGQYSNINGEYKFAVTHENEPFLKKSCDNQGLFFYFYDKKQRWLIGSKLGNSSVYAWSKKKSEKLSKDDWRVLENGEWVKDEHVNAKEHGKRKNSGRHFQFTLHCHLPISFDK